MLFSQYVNQLDSTLTITDDVLSPVLPYRDHFTEILEQNINADMSIVSA